MSRLNPAVAAARSAVRSQLKELAAFADAAPLVLVACSGGTDSLALAAATAFEAPRAGVQAGAVVIDHGLLDESAEVAQRAAAQCARLGLAPIAVERVTVALGDGLGVEAAARAARYAALERVAVLTGAVRVLLGHTLDDQAETVLLALARGAGATALAGMPPRRGLLARPFLGLTRQQTEEVIRAEGLVAWHDPTNQVGGPHPSRRAAVRSLVMPVLTQVLGPEVPSALARTAARLRDDQDYLDAQAAALAARAARVADSSGDAAVPEADVARPGAGVAAPGAGVAESRSDAACPEADAAGLGVGETASGAGETGLGGGGRGLELDARLLAAAHPAVRGRALRRAALAAGTTPGALSAAHLAALDALVANWHGQGPAYLPGGIRAERKCGKLVFRFGSEPNPGEPTDPTRPGGGVRGRK